MADLDELMTQLASAAEGGADLDGRVLCLVRGWRFLRALDEGESLSVECVPANHSGWVGFGVNRPTRSIDAALKLVPEGHRWLLDKRPGAYFRSDGYRAEVYREAHSYLSDRSDVPMHWGPTPALALCIAALKARAASEPKP